MKITLLPENCIACGLCHLYAEKIFDYDDDGIVKFYNTDASCQSFAPDDNLRKASKDCPTQAIICEK